MKRIGIILGMLLLLVVSVTQIYAAPELGRIIRKDEVVDEDIELFGDELTIEEGAVVNGSVTVIGGNLDIAGTINGDVSVMGGEVEFDGTVNGDITVFGGELDIDEDASLNGDCVSIGGNIDNNSDNFSCDNIGGNFAVGITDSFFGNFSVDPPTPPDAPDMPDAPDAPDAPNIHIRYEASSFLRDIGEAITRTILMAAAAWVIASIYPMHLRRITDTVQERPFASGTVGILTTGAFISLTAIIGILTSILIFVCVGILGIPIMLIMVATFAGAFVSGWVAMGHIVGDRMTRRFHVSDNDVVNAAVTGTIVLTLGLGIVSALPSVLGSAAVANLIIIVVGSVGLGAVALTKFGREAYPAYTTPSSDKVNIFIDEE